MPNSRAHKYFIRKASESDLEACVQIIESARAFMRAHGNDVQWVNGYPSRSDLAHDIATGDLYVCCEENARQATGEPLACFVLLPGPDPTYAHIETGSWLNGEPYLVFHRLAVRSSGSGVGTFCLCWITQQAKNVRGDTHELNTPMRALLEKCGFVPCGIIHVADGTPRIAYQHVNQSSE